MRILHLGNTEALDVTQTGGKGASLARLSQAGFEVPPAFVITADTTGEEIREARTQIEEAFGKLSSEFVSVRSSATVEDGEQASWAGQFETFLYVGKPDLISKILACKASAHSDRARAYAEQQGVSEIQVAVVVQKMVKSDSAGVAFSANPVNQNHDEMVIEAVLGLGEALVGGSVTPDTYIVDKDALGIRDKHIGIQNQGIFPSPEGGTRTLSIEDMVSSHPKLSDVQIKEIASQLVKIENHHNHPVDIEWAYERGKLFILQARSITTLAAAVQTKKETSLPDWPQNEIFQWGPIRGRYFYISDYVTTSLTTFPKVFPHEAFPETVLLFHNEHMIWLCNLPDFTSYGQKLFTTYMEDDKFRGKLYKDWRQKTKQLTAIQTKTAETELDKLSDVQLSDLGEEFYKAITDFWTPTLLPELGNYGAPSLLKEDLAKTIKDEAELTAVMETLTAPGELSFYQREELELASANDLEAHQKKYFWLKNSYGHVGVLPVSFFEERKQEVMKDLAGKSSANIATAQRAAKNEIQRKYQLSDAIQKRADIIAQNIVWQDERKRYATENFHYKSLLLHEVARRKGLDPNMLLDHCFEQICGLLISNTPQLQQKATCFGITFHEKQTNLTDNEAADAWERYTGSQTTILEETLQGITASRGANPVVQGKVRVLHSSHGILESDEILVTSMTSPGYIFAMRQAKAVITDVGGLTSHAAIVSRELDIPCVVGTKIATKVLRDGDIVEVDAVNGTVKIIGDQEKPKGGAYGSGS
jgi:phosphoenolpyruvate synthase/pyruvate phosphate dikinase